jgi:hypothetical protein
VYTLLPSRNDRPKISSGFGFEGNDYVFAVEAGGESYVGEAGNGVVKEFFFGVWQFVTR